MTEATNYSDTVRASVQGHRFHWYVGAREALALVLPGSNFAKLHIEGRAVGGSAYEEIADILRERDLYDGTKALEYVQIKHSTARMSTQIGWADLKSTILKFSALDDTAIDENSLSTQTYEYLTNRSLSTKWREFFDTPTTSEKPRHPWTLLTKALVISGVTWTDARVLLFLSRIKILDSNPDVAALRNELTVTAKAFAPGIVAQSVVDRLFVLVSSAASSDPERPVVLNRELVLNAFRVEAVEDLFPCPAQFVPIEGLLDRPEIDLAAKLLTQAAPPPTLLVAPGGIGKTVLMQQIKARLSNENHIVLFDCFANGTYRSLEDLRHRPSRALMQIVNELAFARLCHPILRLEGDGPNVLKTIRRRLEAAAKNLRSRRGPESKIVLLIDAADNAAEFAKDRGENNFATWLFETLTDHPIAGVAVAMSCRDYRVTDVTDQAFPSRIDIQPFDPGMTNSYLRKRRPDLGYNARAALWELSAGNPRVLDYLLRTDFAPKSGVPVPPLDTLTPLSVDKVIADRVAFAMSRLSMAGATKAETTLLLAALVRLPPPIPLSALNVLTGISQVRLESFLVDLTPLLSQSSDGLIFRDEPAQSWARRQVEKTAHAVSDLIVRLEATQVQSVYIAKALPVLLAELGRTDTLRDLAQSIDFPTSMSSPAAQQSLRLIRIREALRACAQDGLIPDCVQLLYTLAMVRGVETRTENFILKWPALAAFSPQADVRRRLHMMNFSWRGERAGYLAQTALVQNQSVVAANDLRKFKESLPMRSEEDKLDTESVSAIVVASMMAGEWVRALHQANRARPGHFRIHVIEAALHLGRLAGLNSEPIFETYLDMVREGKFSASGDPLGLALGLFLDDHHPAHVDSQLCAIAAREINTLSLESQPRDTNSFGQNRPVQAWALSAAWKALAMGRNSDAKRFLAVVPAVETNLYNYHDDYGRHELLTFFKDRCARLSVLKRAPRLSDFLPSDLRRRKHIFDAPDAKALSQAIKARQKYTKPNTARPGGPASKPKRHLAIKSLARLDDEKIHKIVTVTQTLYDAATELSRALSGNDADRAHVLQRVFDQRQALKVSSHERNGHARLMLRDGLTLIFADNLVPFGTTSDAVWSKLTLPKAGDPGPLFVGTQFMRILSRRPAWHASAGSAARDLAAKYLETTDIDSRVEDLAQLANVVALFDRSHAGILVDSILETMDGISSDDHTMFNNIVRLAGRQSGGVVSARVAHRFLNFVEVILSQNDELPWPEIGLTCNSFGFELLARLSRWDARRVLGLNESLSLSLPAHIQSGLITPETAYALFALAPCGFWRGDRPALVAKIILKGLPESYRHEARLSLATQISADASLSEVENFVSLLKQPLAPFHTESGFGHWPDIQPGTPPDKSDWMPSRSLDHDIKPATSPMVSIPASGIDVVTLKAVLAAVDEAPRYKLSPMVAWAKKYCLGEDRERFIDLLFQSGLCSSYVVIRVANALCDHWQDQSPQFETRRKGWARDYIDAQILALGRGSGSITSTLRDISAFTDEPLDALAFHALSAMIRNDAYVTKEEAFAFADALLDQATPEIGKETLCQLILSNTFDIHAETAEGPFSANESPSPLQTPNVVAALIWAQLGSSYVSARWRAGHAICRLAACEQIEVLKSLVAQFSSRPGGRMFPDTMRFATGTAQAGFVTALERAARLHPQAIRPFRNWLDRLVAGEVPNPLVIRAAGNALAYLGGSRDHGAARFNAHPASPFPNADRVGSAWGGFPEKTDPVSGKRFSLEYDFGKYEPERAAQPFANLAAFAVHPETQIINEALSLDPKLENMYDLGGAPIFHNVYHARQSGQIEVYGQMQVHAALQRKAYEWLHQYPLKTTTDDWVSDNYGNTWEYWFRDYRPSSGNGTWLADRTVMPPAFIHIQGKRVVDELDFAPVAPLYDALGWLEDSDMGVVIAGSWHQSDGTSVNVNSILTKAWGSKTACKSLARAPWYDLYLPTAPVDDYLQADFSARFKDATPWIHRPNSEIMTDRLDPFGCSSAGRLPELALSFVDMHRLVRSDEGYLQWKVDGETVALSLAWGRDDLSVSGDRDRTGHALIVRRSWVESLLKKANRGLAMTLRRRTSKREYTAERSISSNEMMHIVCLDSSFERHSWDRRPPKSDDFY